MYNLNDPRRVFADPHAGSTLGPFPYNFQGDPNQVALSPPREGNVVYFVQSPLMQTPLQPSAPPGVPSASNSTSEYSPNVLRNPQLLVHKAGDGTSTASSGVPVSAGSTSLVNMMQPPSASASTFESALMSSANTPFLQRPTTQPTFSQPHSPVNTSQVPGISSQYLPQPSSPSQMQTHLGATTSAPAGPRFVIFPGPPPAPSLAPFYPFPVAASSGPTLHKGAAHLPSANPTPLVPQLPSTTSSVQSTQGGGGFPYSVDTGASGLSFLSNQTISSPPQQQQQYPSMIPMGNAPWSIVSASMQSGGSGLPMLPLRENMTYTGAPSLYSPSQRSITASNALGSGGGAMGNFYGIPAASPISRSLSRYATTGAAAGGSPDGVQPAALGVRNFSAPEPVGSCFIPDLPLDPIIPPLALPCPRWGKLPRIPAVQSG